MAPLSKLGAKFLMPFHLRIIFSLCFAQFRVSFHERRWCSSDRQPHSCSPPQLETLIICRLNGNSYRYFQRFCPVRRRRHMFNSHRRRFQITEAAAQNTTSTRTALECESSIEAHCFHACDTAAGQIQLGRPASYGLMTSACKRRCCTRQCVFSSCGRENTQ